MFEVIIDRLARWVTPFGGRSSSKSWTVGFIIILVSILQKRFIVVARDYKDDVEHSIWRNVVNKIYELDLEPFFNITKTMIKCHITGTEIVPFGLIDNPDKIKSLEGCDLLVMEEAAKVPQYVWEKVVPTIRTPGAAIVTLFNPDWEFDETYKRNVTNQHELASDGYFVRQINYLDNPFCDQSVLNEAEREKERDLEKYEHVWLGKPKKTTKQHIFSGCYEVEDFNSLDSDYFPMNPNNQRYQGDIEYLFGVAFGYSQKKSFVIRCFMFGKVLYIDKEFHGIDVGIKNLASKTFNMPGNDEGITYCDPRSSATADRFCDELSYYGGSTIITDKWTSEEIDSITFMRNQLDKIVVHPDCKGVIECFDWYFWDIDEKENEVLDRPIEKNDEAFHAIRFAITNYVQGYNYL